MAVAGAVATQKRRRIKAEQNEDNKGKLSSHEKASEGVPQITSLQNGLLRDGLPSHTFTVSTSVTTHPVRSLSPILHVAPPPYEIALAGEKVQVSISSEDGSLEWIIIVPASSDAGNTDWSLYVRTLEQDDEEGRGEGENDAEEGERLNDMEEEVIVPPSLNEMPLRLLSTPLLDGGSLSPSELPAILAIFPLDNLLVFLTVESATEEGVSGAGVLPQEEVLSQQPAPVAPTSFTTRLWGLVLKGTGGGGGFLESLLGNLLPQRWRRKRSSYDAILFPIESDEGNDFATDTEEDNAGYRTAGVSWGVVEDLYVLHVIRLKRALKPSSPPIIPLSSSQRRKSSPEGANGGTKRSTASTTAGETDVSATVSSSLSSASSIPPLPSIPLVIPPRTRAGKSAPVIPVALISSPPVVPIGRKGRGKDKRRGRGQREGTVAKGQGKIMPEGTAPKVKIPDPWRGGYVATLAATSLSDLQGELRLTPRRTRLWGKDDEEDVVVVETSRAPLLIPPENILLLPTSTPRGIHAYLVWNKHAPRRTWLSVGRRYTYRSSLVIPPFFRPYRYLTVVPDDYGRNILLVALGRMNGREKVGIMGIHRPHHKLCKAGEWRRGRAVWLRSCPIPEETVPRGIAPEASLLEDTSEGANTERVFPDLFATYEETGFIVIGNRDGQGATTVLHRLDTHELFRLLQKRLGKEAHR